MYKIKSTVGEVKELCDKYLKIRKQIIKNRRVEYIHSCIDDKNIFGKRKYKSVKDVVKHMKKTGDFFGTIWSDCRVRGSALESDTEALLNNISKLEDKTEVWLTEGMAFLFKYKDK